MHKNIQKMQYKTYQYYVHVNRKRVGGSHKTESMLNFLFSITTIMQGLFANSVSHCILLSLLFVLLAGHYISLSDIERWRIAISIRCVLKQNGVVILGLEKTQDVSNYMEIIIISI